MYWLLYADMFRPLNYSCRLRVSHLLIPIHHAIMDSKIQQVLKSAELT